MSLKRTPLRRKKSLRPGSGLKKSGFTKKSYSPLSRKKPLARVSKQKREQSDTPIYSTLTSKSNGLGGVGRSVEVKIFHSRVAALGCIACKKLGLVTVFRVRIHHTDGRYQGGDSDWSEWKVLPLCDQHHHPSLAFEVNGIKPDLSAPSVHDRKKLFTSLVGTEAELVLEIYEALGEIPPWISTGEELL